MLEAVQNKPLTSCKASWSLHCLQILFTFKISALKDKSGVGAIVDYSRDYTVVNGV